jgi:hypothetical protein
MATTDMVTGRIYTPNNTISPLSYYQLLDMKNIGVTSIRVDFEDASGIWKDRVQAYKNILQWCSALGIKVLGLINTDSLLDPTYKPTNTANKVDFENNYLPKFLAAFDWHEQTYGGYASLEGWEIYNEPDVPQYGWYRNGSFMADEYALTLVRLWELKRPGLNRNRKIVMGAMSQADSQRWLEVYKTNTMYYFRNANSGNIPADAVAIHCYGTIWDPQDRKFSPQEGGGDFETQLRRFFGFRDRTSNELVPFNKDVYATELGIDTKQASEQAQALRMKYFYDTLNKFPRIKKGFWYVYRDDEISKKDDTSEKREYGIRYTPQKNAGIKPAWNTFRNLNGKAGVGQTSLWSGSPADVKFLKFLTAFNRNDTAENLMGTPSDNGGGVFVHAWGNAQVQDFAGGRYGTGKAMITLVNGQDVAGAIHGRFYDVWMSKGGGPVVGFPFDNGGGIDRHSWDAGDAKGMVQDIRDATGKKSMIQFETSSGSTGQVHWISGPIYEKYMAGGGVGVYGYARSERYLEGTKYRQKFAKVTISE